MRSAHRTLAACALLAATISSTGAQAWWTACSWMRFYDDEGTTLFAVRRFLDGRALYDSLLSHYGPLYFFYQAAPELLFGAPVDHDSARVLTALSRVLAALAVLLLVQRLTGSFALALAAHWAGFRVLAFLGYDTAHPQEPGILLLLGMALAGTIEAPRWRSLLLGVLIAAALMTKANLGLFMATALLIRVALDAGVGWAAAPTLGVPLLLMRVHLGEPWALSFAATTTLALAGAMRVTGKPAAGHWPARSALAGLAAGSATAAGLASLVVARGTSPEGLLRGLLVQPASGFAERWSQPLSIPAAAPLWALAGLGLAVAVHHRRPWAGPCRWLLLVLLAVVATHGYYAEMLWVAAPLLWIVAVPAGEKAPTAGRRLLAVLAVIQTLYAYPVAGSQTAFAVLLVVVVAAVCAHDALGAPGPRLAAGLVAVVLVLHGAGAARAHRRLAALEPLALPGARHVRVEPAAAQTMRRLAAAAAGCSILVTRPQLHSFNLFADRPAPANMGSAWELFLDGPAQALAVRELQDHPRPCAIVNRETARFWTRGRDLRGPLSRYIDEELQLSFAKGGFEFRTRGVR